MVITAVIVAVLAVAGVLVYKFVYPGKAAGPSSSSASTGGAGNNGPVRHGPTASALPPSGSRAVGHFTLMYDGQDLTNSNGVSCITRSDQIDLGVDGEDYEAVLTNTDPPQMSYVTMVALHNGSSWGYQSGDGGNASVTKDGNTYRITGNAANDGGPSRVLKPFEFDVTCP
jgi:ipoprotein LpqH